MRRQDRSKSTGPTGSTRDWVIDGIAWEIQTTLIAIPALIAAGIVAVLFDASLTMVLVAAVAIALAVRLAVDGWRRLKSADPARSRPPREDL